MTGLMTPTRRRNGQYMVSLGVRHLLNGKEVTQCVAASISMFGEDRLAKPSKTVVRAAVVSLLRSGGNDAYIYAHEDNEEWQEAWETARAIVISLWPEWEPEIPEVFDA